MIRAEGLHIEVGEKIIVTLALSSLALGSWRDLRCVRTPALSRSLAPVHQIEVRLRFCVLHKYRDETHFNGCAYTVDFRGGGVGQSWMSVFDRWYLRHQ